MDKKKAKALIKELQDSITIENIQNQFWMDKVQAYVQAIFGSSEESIAMPMFHTFYFDRPYSKWADEDKLDEIVGRLKEMFDVYIVLIKNNLIVHRNMFSKYENLTIIKILAALIIPLIASTISLTYYFTSNKSDLKKVELYNNNIRLRDSIEILKTEMNEKIKLSNALPSNR